MTAALLTGFGAPFPILPDRVIEVLLTEEIEMVARHGDVIGALVTEAWWDPRLIEICERLGIPALVSTRITRSGTISRFHSNRPGFRTIEELEKGEVSGTGAYASVEVPGVDGIDQAYLRRTFTRLMALLPERLGPATLAALPGAVDGSAFLSSSSFEDRRDARQAILALRVALDRDGHRDPSWGRLSRVDWDGDGSEEIELESSDLLVVFDAADGVIATVADKTTIWPVSSIADDPGWLIARHVADVDQEIPTPVMLAVTSLEESKDGLTVNASGTLGSGTISTSLAARGRRMILTYDLHGIDPGLIGPELSLLLDRSTLRVDGHTIGDITEPMSSPGHKFRISSQSHQLVVSSSMPSLAFLRPADGGLIAWFPWPTDGNGSRQITIDLI